MIILLSVFFLPENQLPFYGGTCNFLVTLSFIGK